MKQLLFATTNSRKIAEARAACDLLGIEVVPIELPVDEIQSRDPLAVSLRKAEDAFRLADGKPIVVTDTSWSIPALNGFPGSYMKDVATWFEPQDFINLMKDKADRTITFRESIIYKDRHETKVFSKEYSGRIADEPRGHDGDAADKVAEFDGRTLAESHDRGVTSHQPEDYIWYEFGQWFRAKFS